MQYIFVRYQKNIYGNMCDYHLGDKIVSSVFPIFSKSEQEIENV